ncbi:Tetratricopeptide repeat-containing protein [Desulforamulus hydrothermalis Lam5 = DSM 18033]|nr:Tetratricopeptide repeat-containing protein [Desulforamulus hydrothermalis Lam5 = DSM 18033]
MFFKHLSPRARQKRLQRIVFGILVAVLSLGLIGSSVVWTGLGSLQKEQAAPNSPEERLALLEKQSQKNPQDKELLLTLAAYYRQAGKLKQAAEAYQKAIQLDPKDIAARQELALLYYAQGDLPAAGQALKQALAVQPDNADLLFQYANLLAEQKDYAGAIAHMKKFLQINKQEGPRADEARQSVEKWQQEVGQ